MNTNDSDQLIGGACGFDPTVVRTGGDAELSALLGEHELLEV